MTEWNGGQLAARQLVAAGIDTVFGVVAGPMIEVLSGAVEAGIRVVNCRHEVSAGLMASAWGFVSGKPGVCVVGSGPGMTNAVTPMHVATESGMPLVVLGGSTYGPTRGLGGFQEADQCAFARPACKWTQQVDSTERIPEWVHLALGKAASGRPGAVYLDFPGHQVSRRVPEERARRRAKAPRIAPPHPDPQAVESLAALLAGAERPLLLIGKGAAWAGAGPALAKLADLGIPYVCSPMARGTIPDDHPHFANGARGEALAAADAILMFGGRFNWIFGFGTARRSAPPARIAQVDVAAEELWSGAELEQGVVADARATAEALVAALAGRRLASAGGAWSKQLAAKRAENEAQLARATASDAVPIDPHRLVRELRDVLPRNARVSVDGETIMGIARQVLPCYVERVADLLAQAGEPARAGRAELPPGERAAELLRGDRGVGHDGGGEVRARERLLRFDVHLHHLRARREAAAEAEDPVEAAAEHHDDIGAGQRLRARGVRKVRVVVGQRAARHRRGDVRDAAVRQRGERGPRIGPRGALADQEERTLGALEQVRRARDRVGIGERARDLGRAAQRHLLLRHLLADEVAGEVEVDAAGPARHGLAEREVDPLRDAVGAVDLAGPLARGLRERELVELLERAEAERAPECRAAEHDQRQRARRGDVEGRDRVREGRARAHDQHARLLLLVAPGLRHEATVQLVPAAHDLQSGLLRAGEELDHRSGHHAEHRVDAGRAQLTRSDLTAVDLRHVSSSPVPCGVAHHVRTS